MSSRRSLSCSCPSSFRTAASVSTSSSDVREHSSGAIRSARLLALAPRSRSTTATLTPSCISMRVLISIAIIESIPLDVNASSMFMVPARSPMMSETRSLRPSCNRLIQRSGSLSPSSFCRRVSAFSSSRGPSGFRSSSCLTRSLTRGAAREYGLLCAMVFHEAPRTMPCSPE